MLAGALPVAAATPAGAGVRATPAPATSIAAAPVKTVTTPQGTIAYRSVGRGRPLVMIMGLSGTMSSWQPSFVDRLARHHRVITFDNAGVGRSSIARGTLTIGGMGENTAALISALQLRRPDVLGWSMGGMIAQALVRKHPTTVRRVILSATAPGDGKATPPTAAAAAAIASPNNTAVLGLLFPPERRRALQAFVAGIGAYGDVPVAPAAVVQRQTAAIGSWLAGKDPAGGSLRRVKTRVLVGHGALDQLLPIANARHLAATLPNATLRAYPRGAHGFLFQEQAVFVPAVERFLR